MAPKKKAVKKAPSVGCGGMESKAERVWFTVYPPNYLGMYLHASLKDAEKAVMDAGTIYTGLVREVVKRRGK